MGVGHTRPSTAALKAVCVSAENVCWGDYSTALMRESVFHSLVAEEPIDCNLMAEEP